jgi:hypothetical protein
MHPAQNMNAPFFTDCELHNKKETEIFKVKDE